MIIEIEKEFEETIKQIQELVESVNCRPDVLYGDLYTVIAVEGDASRLDIDHIQNFPGVVRAWRISSPYKTISRKVIGEGGQKITRERISLVIAGPDGENRVFDDHRFIFIAGPCAVESYDQMATIGEGLSHLADKYHVRDRMILRGGAFKPRTKPWDFRGLGEEALDILDKVRDNTGLPYVTEVMAIAQVSEIAERADILQIGMRNYQNFNLLEAVGKSGKPVLYKRGISAELEEWLSAAEYIALQENKSIILCERGVKSTVHGDYNRSHIDFDVIRAVKDRTILPIIIDPSHSSGYNELVPYQFSAASAYRANGTMVEVIADDIERKTIKCDARQAVRMKVYEKMIQYQLAVEKINIDFEDSLSS
ncbi:3-deoxy-D-arabino-heptulosonate 7-phosphate synthase [bacterium]|nr:3-deoxy-D-arabino-heptulosonate 7-phosphate synthase [bacterium]RQV95056.1 MAG: 3-deoxy-D-arabino-heptulosonate 7-phosphate synthase [bacterium]